MSGYLQVGSESAPANTGAGVLTASRLLIGTDALFPAATVAFIIRSSAALPIRFINTTASATIGAEMGLDTAGNFNFNNSFTDGYLTLTAGGSAAFVQFHNHPAQVQGRFRTGNDVADFATGGSTIQVDMGNSFLRALGYMRVGAIAAPANTTAGDLTAVRLFVGNIAAIAGIEALITGDMVVSGTMTIGASAAPATSAVLDLTSTTGALLVPRMTTTQRDLLTAANGMIIYNTTTATMQGYVAGAWTNL